MEAWKEEGWLLSLLIRKVDPDIEEEEEACSSEAPQKPLAYRFNFIEVCGGAGKVTASMAARGWSVGPVIDIDRSDVYNLRYLEVIRWLFHLVESGMLDSFALEPPCPTFSAAAHPCVRSCKLPRGFCPSDEKTLNGTELALRSLALMYLAAICDVAGLLETPLLSKMAWLEEWRTLVELGLCHETKLHSCMYGSPRMKGFRMLLANVTLRHLSPKCDHAHEHLRIEGKWTRPSATYTDELAGEIAAAFDEALVIKFRKAKTSDFSIAGLESPLVNDVLVSAPWKLRSSWRWKGSSHINIYEAATFGRLLKDLAGSSPSTRFSAALDSNVALSAICKGRSAALGLRPTLRRIGATTIAGDLYPALHFAPTRLNPSDPPSRGLSLWTYGHTWISDLDFEALLDLGEIPGLKRAAANWVRLFLAVANRKWLGNRCSWRFASWHQRRYPVRYLLKGTHATN